MSLPASFDRIAGSFPHNSKKEWAEAAKQELEGADPFEKLTQRVGDLKVLPYYDARDASSTGFVLSPSQNELAEPRAWSNLALISVHNAKAANERALQALLSGADGVIFDLHTQVDPAALLNKIEWPYCHVSFLTDGGQEDFFRGLNTFRKSKKYSTESLSGAIYWKSALINPRIFEIFSGWAQFRSIGIHEDDGASPADSLAALVAKAVKQIDVLTTPATKIKNVFDAVAFSVSIGQDFFLEIARLKALRWLWMHIAEAYDLPGVQPVHIHGSIKRWHNTAFEPHGNLIAGASAAVSAILGGCDSITVEPEDRENSMMERVARNVSSIVREESHLGKVADPTAGSFYLESLTHQLAESAWQKFQHLMK